MATYVYVLATVHSDGEGMISFKSAIVDAPDKDVAYMKGMHWGEDQGWFPTKGPSNDYVVEVG